MNSGKGIVSCSYSHLWAFVPGLFHHFNGKWFNDRKIKTWNLWPHKLRCFPITMNYHRKNYSSIIWNSKASPSLSAAIRHLESFLVQLSMNCFINFTACMIISFLFHQIKLKAAWFFICQMSRNFSIVYLNILTLYKVP